MDFGNPVATPTIVGANAALVSAAQLKAGVTQGPFDTSGFSSLILVLTPNTVASTATVAVQWLAPAGGNTLNPDFAPAGTVPPIGRRFICDATVGMLVAQVPVLTPTLKIEVIATTGTDGGCLIDVYGSTLATDKTVTPGASGAILGNFTHLAAAANALFTDAVPILYCGPAVLTITSSTGAGGGSGTGRLVTVSGAAPVGAVIMVSATGLASGASTPLWVPPEPVQLLLNNGSTTPNDMHATLVAA